MINFALVRNYTTDNMLWTVLMPQYIAVGSMYHLYGDYVG